MEEGFTIQRLRLMRDATAEAIQTCEIPTPQLVSDVSDTIAKLSELISVSLTKGENMNTDALKSLLKPSNRFYTVLRDTMLKRYPSLVKFFKKLSATCEKSEWGSPVRIFRLRKHHGEFNFALAFEHAKETFGDIENEIRKAVAEFFAWALESSALIVIGPQLFAVGIMVGLLALSDTIGRVGFQIANGLARALFVVCSLYLAMWAIYREVKPSS